MSSHSIFRTPEVTLFFMKLPIGVHSHNKVWIERHGEPDMDRLMDVVVNHLYRRTHGRVDLITDQVLADVYGSIFPDVLLEAPEDVHTVKAVDHLR